MSQNTTKPSLYTCMNICLLLLLLYVCVCVCVCLPNPIASDRIWYTVIFQRSTAGASSEFSFSWTCCFFKSKEHNVFRKKRQIAHGKCSSLLSASLCVRLWVYLCTWIFVCIFTCEYASLCIFSCECVGVSLFLFIYWF